MQTTQQVLQQQKQEAAKAHQPANTAVVKAGGTAVALPDTRTPQQAYLDEVAPSGIVGRMIKWSKEGKFVTTDDEEEVSSETDFVALCDATLVGWMRFHEDAAPDRIMGLLYGSDFRMPQRDELGDLDEGQWATGLSGKPEDPWKHTMYLVLQQAGTSEMFTFTTSSVTGRRAVGNLLHHFQRMERTHGDAYPIVRLKKGGFNHRDERIGWVATPAFAVVGRAPKDNAVKPDTSVAADLNDEIPSFGR
jgi:hypothetical protein